MNKIEQYKNWDLKEKEDVKYFQLRLEQEKIECMVITSVGGLSFPSENPDLLKDNLKQIERIFGIKQVNILKQTHSDRSYYMPEDFKFNYSLDGDGLYTDKANVFMGVRIADCLPIFLFNQTKKIIGIVHSGWKGTLQEISKKMILTMRARFNLKPIDISFAFGPSIGQCCYEINSDLAHVFSEFARARNIRNALIEQDNKSYLNLKLINQKILENTGLRNKGIIDLCSFCEKDLLFSSRRKDVNKRNLAIIGYRE